MTAATPSPALEPAGSYLSLGRNRPFRTLLAAEMLCFGGEALLLTLLPWLALEASASNSVVGWVTAATYLPFLLLGMPAGTLADHVDRRRLMIGTNLLRLVIVVPVPLLYARHSLATWMVLLLAFLQAALSILFRVARDAALPKIVSRRQLVTANAMRMVFISLAMMAGSALVGPIVRQVGMGRTLIVYVLTFILSSLCLWRLRLPTQSTRSPAQEGLSWREALRGLSYAWHDRVLRALFLLEVVYYTFADGPISVGIPLFVRDVLRGGPEAYGYMRTANYLGLLMAGLLLGRYGTRIHKGRLVVIGWLGWGLALMGYAVCHTLPPVLFVAFLSNLMGNLIPISEGTFIQERVPHEMMGRVSGVWNMIAPGWGVVSGLVGGAMAGVLPAAMLVVVGAAFSCNNALLGLRQGLWKQR